MKFEEQVLETVEKFKKWSSYLDKGAPTISKQFNVPVSVIIEAKKRVRENQEETMVVDRVWKKTKDGTTLYKNVIEQPNLHQVLQDVLDKIHIPLIVQEYYSVTKRGDEHLLVVNLVDLHLNKKDTKGKDSLESQKAEILQTLSNLLDLSARTFNIGKVLVICGHDYFHSDFNGHTTKGTHVGGIKSNVEMFGVGLQMAVDSIKICGQYGKVDFVVVNGNHDYYTSQYMAISLKHIFESSKEVNIITLDSNRMYYEYEDNGFLLSHDFPKDAKHLPLIFAAERPDLFTKKNKFILTGHLHSNETTFFKGTQENYGLIWKQCPSLSKTDRWHEDNWFIGNHPTINSMVFHSQDGWKAEFLEKRIN